MTTMMMMKRSHILSCCGGPQKNFAILSEMDFTQNCFATIIVMMMIIIIVVIIGVVWWYDHERIMRIYLWQNIYKRSYDFFWMQMSLNVVYIFHDTNKYQIVYDLVWVSLSRVLIYIIGRSERASRAIESVVTRWFLEISRFLKYVGATLWESIYDKENIKGFMVLSEYKCPWMSWIFSLTQTNIK